MISAFSIDLAVREQPVHARHAHVEDALDLLPASSAVSAASSATGMSAVPALTHGDEPRPRSGAGTGPTHDARGTGRWRAAGHRGHRRPRRPRRETRVASTVEPPRAELDQDRGDLLGRLPLAEHDLGEAVRRWRCVSACANAERPERQLAQLAHRIVNGSPPARHRLEQSTHSFRIHGPRILLGTRGGSESRTIPGIRVGFRWRPRLQLGAWAPSPVSPSAPRIAPPGLERKRFADEPVGALRRFPAHGGQNDDGNVGQALVRFHCLEHLPP